MRVRQRAFSLVLTVLLLSCLALAQSDSSDAYKAQKAAEKSGEAEQAIPPCSALTQGLFLTCKSAVRLNNLGVAYLNQQQMEQGLELFQQASKLDSSLEAARLNQAIALLNLQRHEEALGILLGLTETSGDNPQVWYNLGLVHRAQGQAEAALDAFNRVAELDPDDANVHYFRGLNLSQLQRYQEAIASFQRAIELEPFHVSAEFGLARAYQRTGATAQARIHLSRFQQLTQENLGAPISLFYGEQGNYSLAIQIRPPTEAASVPIEVTYKPVEAEAGLDFEHSGWRFPDQLELEQAAGAHDLAAFFGSGACVLDFDADGHPDVFFVNSGENARGALYRNDGQGHFADVTEESGLEARGHGLGCAAGDYDNDGRDDLAVSFLGRIALYRNAGEGRFVETTKETGVETSGFPLGLMFVDYDHDGDLDLYVARFVGIPEAEAEENLGFPFSLAPTTNILWRNNGNSTFTDWTAPTGLAGTAPTVSAVATDFNNDRAADLVLTGWRNAPALLANPREGQFKLQELWADAMPSATAGAVVLDFNKDGWMDLAFTHWGAPGLTLWKNLEGRRFELVSIPSLGWRRAWGLAAFDYDNDGWLDLAAVGETKDTHEIRLLRNQGPGGFSDATSIVGLAELPLRDPRALLTTDFDADGDTDLLITQNAGPVHLLRNDGGHRNSWLRVSLKGLADNRAAIGTKVEIYAGTGWQKWEVQGSSGYLGQSQLDITAGLGPEGEAEIVRLLWPTGVLQDEIQLPARAIHTVNQIDRRGSSCPVLFAWNGERYEFVSDIIGAAIVGHWVGPGQRNISDPDEYVKVPGTLLQPRDGRLSLRLMEPMEELIYLDQARLLAVDHPADVAVFPNEYFAATIPPPEFKVVVSRGARPPQGAWDDKGRDVLDLLLETDRRYVEGFALDRFKGFAELHALELDLGEWNAERPLRLILRGFIEYFTANSVYAAHQTGVYAAVPYVEALDESGQWVRVIDDMGFPAGLARTMVADLTGRVPPGTRRIRIVTNLQIYWDQVLIDNSPEDLPVRLHEVPLAESNLNFLGFPRAIEREPKGDLTYIYEEVSASGPYARPRGSYTRYGDVFPLLTEIDDRYAIFGPGEEVALEFDPAGLPPLPEGWQRDFFFFADGFVKDMDFYEAHALSVAPLPFHTMGTYPYPKEKSYPADAPMLDYHFDYNIRHLNQQPAWLFRFDYAGEEE
jgi:tetratricopeptide (TPR) repeat protein